ncbi:hypothetical protein PSN45_000989 [Yamadazyma tenuis]|uniref:Ras-domain-containing protein n=1 Tax=Candida tenuis (strain ATCC 10573 / BCRC 21748 / CBS 615 / JCM 9827 / NBRC 10315 / NRRL Y-1498 / VKM Y-70) TaxID=590646 RepID=G3B7G0_CANTC|nr:uncharacterized protein CANTEDRAFT_131641 [Yamadazyma tenuis ATCC 10573]EGV62268.1 hypothetical protein CANTEDRAFT_131641 [Yamadazyma tenuis ATCC 10573]WEJ93524.1 hypothetical protein PSN45_000989 [Yamadazyma tenuis]
MDTETPTFKVVLLGDSGVGKTCIRSQFVHHIFTNAYKATIGGDYLTSTVMVTRRVTTDDAGSNHDTNDIPQPQTIQKPIKTHLQIWDTAGQERFNSISRAFYRGTDIVVLVYDITNYESLLNLKTWFKNFMDHCQVPHPGVIVVGNKSDQASDRVIDLEEIKEILTLNINSGTDSDINLNNYVNWETDAFEICCKKLDLVNKVFYRVGEVGLDLIEENPKKDIVAFDTIDIGAGQRASKCFC